jgi:predicted nucleic acid-binding protein
VSGELLLDNSAWTRLGHAKLPAARSAEIADAVQAGQIFACLPFLLEAGYSARNAAEHDELMSGLLALPWAPVDEDVERRATEAQRQLARCEHHRLPPVDVLVAALADRHGLGVLHYDHDYDVIRSKTDLTFESVWLAQPGSL